MIVKLIKQRKKGKKEKKKRERTKEINRKRWCINKHGTRQTNT
jgi:hypothetical protein